MSFVQRAINILTKPAQEWQVIASEPASTGSVFGGYVAIIALLFPIGKILGSLLFAGLMGGIGAGVALTFTLVSAVLLYVVYLGTTFLMTVIGGALAGSFGGQPVPGAALKLIAYSSTPLWVAGFLSFIPILNILIYLAAYGYAGYLIYLGAPRLLNMQQSSAGGYGAVTAGIWLVIDLVVSLILGAILAAIFFTAALGAAGAMMR